MCARLKRKWVLLDLIIFTQVFVHSSRGVSIDYMNVENDQNVQYGNENQIFRASEVLNEQYDDDLGVDYDPNDKAQSPELNQNESSQDYQNEFVYGDSVDANSEENKDIDNDVLAKNDKDEAGFDLSNDEIEKFHIWRDGVVPYFIDTQSYDKVLRDKIRFYIHSISDQTGVHFSEYSLPPDQHVKRWLMFLNRRGQRNCQDYNVNDFTNQGMQVVRIGYDCFSHGGNIAAAVLALLGVPAQHTAPDRDCYVNVKTENIMEGKAKIFEKLDDSDWIFHYLPYDYCSASHSSFHAYSKNGKEVMTVVPERKLSDCVVGEAKGMSKIDIKKVELLYNHILYSKREKNIKAECNKIFEFKTDGNKKLFYHVPKQIPPAKKPGRYTGTEYNGKTNCAQTKNGNGHQNLFLKLKLPKKSFMPKRITFPKKKIIQKKIIIPKKTFIPKKKIIQKKIIIPKKTFIPKKNIIPKKTVPKNTIQPKTNTIPKTTILPKKTIKPKTPMISKTTIITKKTTNQKKTISPKITIIPKTTINVIPKKTVPKNTIQPKTKTIPKTTILPKKTIKPKTPMISKTTNITKKTTNQKKTISPKITIIPKTTNIPKKTIMPQSTIISKTTANPKKTITPKATIIPKTTVTLKKTVTPKATVGPKNKVTIPMKDDKGKKDESSIIDGKQIKDEKGGKNEKEGKYEDGKKNKKEVKKKKDTKRKKEEEDTSEEEESEEEESEESESKEEKEEKRSVIDIGININIKRPKKQDNENGGQNSYDEGTTKNTITGTYENTERSTQKTVTENINTGTFEITEISTQKTVTENDDIIFENSNSTETNIDDNDSEEHSPHEDTENRPNSNISIQDDVESL